MFSLSMTSNKKQYRSLDPINFSMHVTNLTKKDLFIEYKWDYNSRVFIYILNQEGKDIKKLDVPLSMPVMPRESIILPSKCLFGISDYMDSFPSGMYVAKKGSFKMVVYLKLNYKLKKTGLFKQFDLIAFNNINII